MLDVDKLAQEIRRLDDHNGHSLGAGALAEALMPFLSSNAPTETKRKDAQKSIMLKFAECCDVVEWEAAGEPIKWKDIRSSFARMARTFMEAKDENHR